LGRIELQEERLDEAIDALKRAVDLNENNSVYRTWLGRAYIAKLQTVSFFAKGTIAGRALEQLEKAVKLDPTNVEARVSLAGYYSNAPSIAGGSSKKARQQLEYIMEYEPVRAKAILANLLIKDKEYDRAIETLEECIAAEPAELQHRYRLGMLYQQLERFDDAFEVFENVLETDPGDPGALYQLGRTAVFSSTNLERGVECLRAYLEKPVKPGYPGHDAAHWRLGMLFEHRGNRALAKKEYEAALLLEPAEEKYRDALKELERN
jgi:tetratricopeptide (TPR) repeat protein